MKINSRTFLGVPAILSSRAAQNSTDPTTLRPEEHMVIAVGGSTVRLATAGANEQQHIALARVEARQEVGGSQEQQLRINLNQREGMFAFIF